MHILIGCEGHEPGVMRIIQRALKLLTPQCVFHDENKPLLPKLQPTPLPGVENGVRVDAGSLGLAASGDVTAEGPLNPLVGSRTHAFLLHAQQNVVCALAGHFLGFSCAQVTFGLAFYTDMINHRGSQQEFCRCSSAATPSAEEEGTGRLGTHSGAQQQERVR